MVDFIALPDGLFALKPGVTGQTAVTAPLLAAPDNEYSCSESL
jgi:hypothetical protein